MSFEALIGERRQQDRRPLRAPATLLFPGGQTMDVRSLDISTQGMSVVTAVSPKIGMKFSIRVTIPQRPVGIVQFETLVQVAHTVFAADENGCKVGLRFMTLDAAAVAAINKFLAGK